MISAYRALKVLILGGSILLVAVFVVLNWDGQLQVRLDGSRAKALSLPLFLFIYAVSLWVLALLFAFFDRLERRSRRSRLLKKIRAQEKEIEALRKLPLLDRLGRYDDLDTPPERGHA